MARSRNVKPGFFTNDELAELPALTRLFFIGIWTLADRDGRLEDRPKKIKAETLPYDECDPEQMLQALHDAGFIERYQVGDAKVIRIVTWQKHQNPHVKEAASSLPAPIQADTSTGQEPGSPVPETEQAGLIPSSLIPDSTTLIPDSLSHEQAGRTPDPVDGVTERTGTPAGMVCRQLRQAGISDASPGHPRFVALLDAGATAEEFLSFVAAAILKDRPFAYLLGSVEGERKRAVEMAGKVRRGAMPNKQESIEQSNRAVGKRWASQTED